MGNRCSQREQRYLEITFGNRSKIGLFRRFKGYKLNLQENCWVLRILIEFAFHATGFH
jgi:hypothetical protein